MHGDTLDAAQTDVQRVGVSRYDKNSDPSQTGMRADDPFVRSRLAVPTNAQLAILRPSSLIGMQRTIGNTAVTRYLQRQVLPVQRSGAEGCSCGGACGCQEQIPAEDEEHETDNPTPVSRQATTGLPIQRACPDDMCKKTAAKEEKKKKEVAPGVAGHTGRALQVEIFLQNEGEGLELLPTTYGIYINRNMTNAGEFNLCENEKAPVKAPDSMPHCIYVPASLNQQAYAFNSLDKEDDDGNVRDDLGGKSRDQWRLDTLMTLKHEIQHSKFEEESPTPDSDSNSSDKCSEDHSDFHEQMSELSSYMSEFEVLFGEFKKLPVDEQKDRSHPFYARIAKWGKDTVLGSHKHSLRNIYKEIRCMCDCEDIKVDALVQRTFEFATEGWESRDKEALNKVIRRYMPEWPLAVSGRLQRIEDLEKKRDELRKPVGP